MIYHPPTSAVGYAAVGELRSGLNDSHETPKAEFAGWDLDRPTTRSSECGHEIRLLPHIHVGHCLRPKKCGRPKLSRKSGPAPQTTQGAHRLRKLRRGKNKSEQRPCSDDSVLTSPHVQSGPKIATRPKCSISHSRRKRRGREVSNKGAVRPDHLTSKGMT